MAQDKHSQLYFAPLQGDTAANLVDTEIRSDLSTFVYHRPTGEFHYRSHAVLYALADAQGSLSLPAKLIAKIPQALLNPIYNWIASRRYSFFAKERCGVLNDSEAERMLP